MTGVQMQKLNRYSCWNIYDPRGICDANWNLVKNTITPFVPCEDVDIGTCFRDFSWKWPPSLKKINPQKYGADTLGVRGVHCGRIPARGGGTQREPNRFIICLIFNTALQSCSYVWQWNSPYTVHTQCITSACLNLLHGWIWKYYAVHTTAHVGIFLL